MSEKYTIPVGLNVIFDPYLGGGQDGADWDGVTPFYFKSIAEEIEQEDPDGADEIIGLHKEDQ